MSNFKRHRKVFHHTQSRIYVSSMKSEIRISSRVYKFLSSLRIYDMISREFNTLQINDHLQTLGSLLAVLTLKNVVTI